MSKALSKKAVALLRKVQIAILEEPKRLEMSDWGFEFTENDVKYCSHLPECGTQGCIAGWTCFIGLQGKKGVPTRTINGHVMPIICTRDIKEKAIELLGLTNKQAINLFFLPAWVVNEGGGWPQEFAARYNNARNCGSKEGQAIATFLRIEHFIKYRK